MFISESAKTFFDLSKGLKTFAFSRIFVTISIFTFAWVQTVKNFAMSVTYMLQLVLAQPLLEHYSRLGFLLFNLAH